VLIKQWKKFDRQYSRFKRRSNTICCHVDCWLLNEIRLTFHIRRQSHCEHVPSCRRHIEFFRNFNVIREVWRIYPSLFYRLSSTHADWLNGRTVIGWI
jgi:hypothetical protein